MVYKDWKHQIAIYSITMILMIIQLKMHLTPQQMNGIVYHNRVTTGVISMNLQREHMITMAME